jgi:opacity protein-like surface antigen
VRIPRVLLAVALASALSGCAAATAAPVASPAPIGHSELQLIGDWTGVADDHGDGVIDMTVGTAADDGSGFDGDLTFAIAGAQTTQAVHAAMTPHGHLVAEIGDDASIELHIVDPATLDYCFSRYGTDFVYSCGQLTRLP